MTDIYNIYCDESCHLENDHNDIMVLGALSCPAHAARQTAKELRNIKIKHKLSPKFEIKWRKVSPGKIDFYLEIVNYFFENQNFSFRALVIDKSKLRHSDFGQSHDDWYYKMYFNLLKVIIEPDFLYYIYLDIKDTRSETKIQKLLEVLCKSKYDFNRSIIKRIQAVHSQQVEHIQIADLLIGAVSYTNRNLNTSPEKLNLLNHIKNKTGYSLTRTTLLREKKFNILIWRAQEDDI
jgi:hypothetical protein